MQNDKKKIFFFPPFAKAVEGNPYTRNYKNELQKYYNVVDCDTIYPKGRRNVLFKKAFVADVYILNWIESIKPGLKSLALFLPSILALYIIRLRRKKIVWMLHNLEPHEGLNFYSRRIMSFLYKHSSIIVTHSKEAYEYAISKTSRPVHFVCHPVQRINCGNQIQIEPVDLFIWGSILPYKGIAEFVADPKIQQSGMRIKILGKCNDKALTERINEVCATVENITFENRRAENDELVAFCKTSKFVVFPYLPGSVSSSGALIDTLVMGGTPIGPNVGAFKDLADEDLCFAYDNMEDFLRIVNDNNKINPENVENFIEKNSWESMVLNLNKWISSL